MWAVDEALATVLGLDRRNDRTIADLHRTNLARMASFKGLIGRLRGEQVSALTAEVAAMREVVLNINHVVTQLNHDIRSGADRSLPLFLGYSERLRLDADTAVGATQVIERQLALLDERLGAVAEPS